MLHRTAIAIAAVAALAVAGCGSDDSKPAASRGSSSGSAIPTSLAGNYARTVTQADIARTKGFRDEGPDGEEPKPGPNTLVISEGTPSGTVAVTDKTGWTVPMDATATPGGVLRLTSYKTPEKGTFCGYWIPSPGHYTWKLNGNVLTLKSSGDPCADRDSTLTGRWTRR